MKLTINQNVDLNELQYKKAVECVQFVKSMMHLRDSDPSFKDFRPAETWDRKNARIQDYVKITDYIMQHPDNDIINKLRLFTGAFTGKYPIRDFTWENFLENKKNILSMTNESLMDISLTNPGHLKLYQNWHEAILPEKYRVETPNVLGEFGYSYNGTICNYQTIDYFERMSILYEIGVLSYLENRSREQKRGISFMEIGAGYGALAYMLSKAVPARRYFIVDIPESLLFSSIYLSTVFPDKKVFCVADPEIVDFSADGIYIIPNLFWHDVSARIKNVDIVINTLSFHEMPKQAVEAYAKGVKEIFKTNGPGSEGFIFEQNFDNAEAKIGCNAKSILRNNFFSEVPSPVYTLQTRGYSELHAPDCRTITDINAFRPHIKFKLKLLSRLSLSYLLPAIKKLIPKKMKELIKRAFLKI